MNNIKMRRAMAYLVDIVIVILIIGLLGKINILNPNLEKIDKIVTDINDYVSKIDNTTVNDIKTLITGEYGNKIYALQKAEIYQNITMIFVIVFYYTFFPFLFNGQTVGKRIMKLKLIDARTGEKPKFIKLFLRSLIIPLMFTTSFYFVGSGLIDLVFLGLLSQKYYLYLVYFIALIVLIYGYMDGVYFFAKKEHMALHDLIVKTDVIDLRNNLEKSE